MASCERCIHKYCCKYDRFFGIEDVENKCNYFKNTAMVIKKEVGEVKFIKEYGLYILIAIAIIVMLGVFVLPLCVGIARDMWQWALYGTM